MSLINSRIYVVGRDPDPTGPRIVVQDKSVSRTHASLAARNDGSFDLTDLKSTNGTFVRESGGWRRVGAAVLHIDDEVRLGSHISTVRSLVEKAVTDSQPVRLERNVETGEIIRRTK